MDKKAIKTEAMQPTGNHSQPQLAEVVERNIGAILSRRRMEQSTCRRRTVDFPEILTVMVDGQTYGNRSWGGAYTGRTKITCTNCYQLKNRSVHKCLRRIAGSVVKKRGGSI